MATVTVTETGVTLQVQLIRDEGGVERVLVTAVSLTDVPAIAGRVMRDEDITASLTAPQLGVVSQVLDFIEAKAKANWNIP